MLKLTGEVKKDLALFESCTQKEFSFIYYNELENLKSFVRARKNGNKNYKVRNKCT